jgi:hypothetical protein
MAASGHKPSNVHARYLNFTDQQLTDAVHVMMVSLKIVKNCSRDVPTPNRLKIRALQVIEFTYARMVE